MYRTVCTENAMTLFCNFDNKTSDFNVYVCCQGFRGYLQEVIEKQGLKFVLKKCSN